MRRAFHNDLDGLVLQVELMGLRVVDAIEMAGRVARTGDTQVATAMLDSDDPIDAMHTSLTEKAIELLIREQPVASDLRLVLSVMRVVDSLERMGDLALRVANHAGEIPLICAHSNLADAINALADHVAQRVRAVMRAWARGDLDALAVYEQAAPLSDFIGPVMTRVTELSGDDAARVAVATYVIGHSFDRIADHADLVANRLRFMVTGNVAFLAAEVG